MRVKKIFPYILVIVTVCLLHACTAWDDTWDEIIPLPRTDDTVIVEPWQPDEKEDSQQSGLGT